MHELEVEVAQETQESKIEIVSIDSVHLNKNQSLITAHLEMQAGENIIKIPLKLTQVVRATSCHCIYSKFVLKYNRGIA